MFAANFDSSATLCCCEQRKFIMPGDTFIGAKCHAKYLKTDTRSGTLQ